MAQLPDNGVCPSGILLQSYVPIQSTASYAMGQWDIDSILDSGTPVLISMMASWSGPTWNFYNAGVLNDLYNSTGWGGAGDVAIFQIETDANTAPETLEGIGQISVGDFISGSSYPVVNDDNIATIFNLSYYPTMVLICPDRTVTEVNQNTEAFYIAAISNCNGLSNSLHDPRILLNTSTNEGVSCVNNYPVIDISAVIQNYSTAPINGDYDIEVLEGPNIVGVGIVNLNLLPYEAVDIMVTTVTPATGNHNYEIKITTPNDDISNDSIIAPITITEAEIMDVYPSIPADVSLSVQFGSFANEFAFVFDEGVPYTNNLSQIYNDALNQVISPIEFLSYNSLSAGTQTYSTTIPVDVSANSGCHYFMFVDSVGNGLYHNILSTGATISSPIGGYSFVNGAWGEGVFKVVRFNQASGIKDNAGTDLAIYPNPASDVVNLNLNEIAIVSVNIVNSAGQIVYTNDLGFLNDVKTLEIPVTDLENGIYFLNTIIDGEIKTERLSVIK